MARKLYLSRALGSPVSLVGGAGSVDGYVVSAAMRLRLGDRELTARHVLVADFTTFAK